jgi:hypothetical protein
MAEKDPDKLKQFHEVALAKCRLSERTGLSTRDVLSKCPELLVENDYLYIGSAIDEYSKIIVATSGSRAVIDECISKLVLDVIKMTAIMRKEKYDSRTVVKI